MVEMKQEKEEISPLQEEVKEMKKPSPVQKVDVSKPDLNKVLSGQTSNGSWQRSSQAVLAAFIDGDNIMDDEIN